ncbi:hypothetical protein PENSTE_c003G02656 [Penicillium steckii]|uniref:Myb-like domain-containing protein n=1 Tax=Penicillium steckii TaxID=303698 RepID=A0A1V6TR33_9EURO|nr:hypothetical protein PENSTE_c003G02656 [Penicillium steckii]
MARISLPPTNMSKSHEHDAQLSNAPATSTEAKDNSNGNNSTSKRKRNSEPGHKSRKNKKQYGGDQVNGDPSDADETNSGGLDEPSMEANGSQIDNDGKRVRGPRVGAKSGKKIGFFEEDETRAMENHKVNFCNLNGISASEFDAMVQHSDRADGDFPCPGDVCTKAEFWSNIYDILPNRERRSVYRFMRRHFQTSDQKPHEWTDQQDKELIDLIAQFGPKYALVAKMLGRTDDDVTQRWKNRLEHRSTMQYGPWSQHELDELVRYVSIVGQSHQESGFSGDVYEMDEKVVPWGKISDQMNNTRSRQQCADKWRKIRKTVLDQRAFDPNAVFDPSQAGRRSSRRSETPRVIKSKRFVEDNDSDDEEVEQVDQSALSAPESYTTAKDPSPELSAEVESHPDLEPASHQEDAGSSSDAGTPSSPALQRSNPIDEEKRRKKLQKAKEERELAEARGFTAAQAKEERKRMRKEQKEEKKRRRSLKISELV